MICLMPRNRWKPAEINEGLSENVGYIPNEIAI